MTEAFIKKNVKLSLEFDAYMAKHPHLLEKIPNGAYVVITIKDDKKFNKDSLSTVEYVKHKKIVEAYKTTMKWNVRPLQLQAV